MPGRIKKLENPKPPPLADTSHFSPRVIAVILIILFIFLGWTFFWLLNAERQSLLEQRTKTLGEHVSIARSICASLDDQAQTGALSIDQARRRAADQIADLSYGDLGQGIFYVFDSAGIIQAHGLRPDLHGENVSNLQDATGRKFIKEIIRSSRATQRGVMKYDWQWVGSGEAATHIASFTAFESWDWIIVSEMPLEDIDSRVTAQLNRQIIVLFVLTAVLAIVISTTLRRLVLSGVDRLIEATQQLESGDLSARVPVNPTDEMNTLAKSFNLMAEGIQSRNAQVRLAQRASVFALAKLAEARDNETGGHLLRVREYASALAGELRKRDSWRDLINAEFLADFYDATMLHDIGKVAVPDRILLKPDVLDEGEMAIMMSHTLVGANTIRAARIQMKVESTFLEMAEEIARSHHERWDGSGYVESLVGKQIPPTARIFTVADVYDALTTTRPYKPAYTHDRAVEEMLSERGKRFDPEVFDVFITLDDEFKRIRREFSGD